MNSRNEISGRNALLALAWFAGSVLFMFVIASVIDFIGKSLLKFAICVLVIAAVCVVSNRIVKRFRS